MKRLLPLCVLGVLAGCYSENTDSTATLGTVGAPTEATATTLLVEVFDTESDITVTLPPDTLFGGDLCTALVANDFASVRIDGHSPGELVDFGALSLDSCGYTISSDRIDLQVLVEARTALDMQEPAVGAGVEPDVIEGIGLAAIGYAPTIRTYVVIVNVDNGYFSVTTPDASSATKLARIAAGRAAG